ncbi:hypothetical protein EXU30_07980 [Shewanella maritima]|uniref:GlyGly-CTERM sorting domain-containing protein n=1 Tax=Shewanella maritima TaxID=2520507 RepID=A0A411PGG3_9GAMM|nr:hypothetical protein [Shewanella maritima]QBF82635.1 hypothetical protein EXU30_07980 [Shewanella maritima]
MNSLTDNATYLGDIMIGGATIEPFETCTYEVESVNGYEGVLVLDDEQVISINKGKGDIHIEETGSGSLGFLSLLGLLGLSLALRNSLIK